MVFRGCCFWVGVGVVDQNFVLNLVVQFVFISIFCRILVFFMLLVMICWVFGLWLFMWVGVVFLKLQIWLLVLWISRMSVVMFQVFILVLKYVLVWLQVMQVRFSVVELVWWMFLVCISSVFIVFSWVLLCVCLWGVKLVWIIVLVRFLWLVMWMWWLLKIVLVLWLVVNSLLWSGLKIIVLIGLLFLIRVMDIQQCGKLCRQLLVLFSGLMIYM